MRTKAPIVRVLAPLAVAAAIAIFAAPAGAFPDFPGHQVVQHNLVSDLPGVADLQDTSLVNPWGLAQGPTSPTWVADNGTSLSTLYAGDTVVAPPSIIGLTVHITGTGPTGTVFNPTGQFLVNDGAGHSATALFIFAHLSGDITGWNPTVPPPPTSTVAQPAVHTAGAVYTGLALVPGDVPQLLAANFAAGTIDVFDGSFQPVHTAGALVDPTLPAGYSPFNVAFLDGKVYVAYAKVDPATHEEQAGSGLGIVDVYDTAGHLMNRIVDTGRRLNAPWGMAIAPANFGSLGGDLLVGNFGNGRINAFDTTTGNYHGTLRNPDGGPVVIEKLWGIMFGNGTTAATNTLLFAAGIDDEAHGLYGALTPKS